MQFSFTDEPPDEGEKQVHAHLVEGNPTQDPTKVDVLPQHKHQRHSQ